MPKKPALRPEDQESHLKKFREELGISQEDLARELGVSSQTISRWEHWSISSIFDNLG